jgi:hypothetical protein
VYIDLSHSFILVYSKYIYMHSFGICIHKYKNSSKILLLIDNLGDFFAMKTNTIVA